MELIELIELYLISLYRPKRLSAICKTPSLASSPSTTNCRPALCMLMVQEHSACSLDALALPLTLFQHHEVHDRVLRFRVHPLGSQRSRSFATR